MFKKDFVKGPTPQRTFPGTTTYPLNIPHGEIDERNMQKLFIAVQSGDLNSIKSFNDATFRLKNSDNQTVIHVVIDNPESEEYQKYDLVKYLLDRGAGAMEYDKYNVTPLHLAAKYQLPTVAKLLLEYGADPNVYDNQHMTPLHYATKGEIVTCEKRRKVGSIVPKESIKKDATVDKNDAKKMGITIIDILQNKQFSKFISHIKSNFENIDKLYQKELHDKKVNLENSSTKILADTSINEEDKKKKINENITNFATEFKKIITNDIEQSLKPIEIEPNQVDGWGPTDNNIEKIIPKIPYWFILGGSSNP